MLVQQVLREVDAFGAVVGQVIVGEVRNVGPHQRHSVYEPRIAAEGEALFGADRAAREQRRLEVDVRDVRVLRVRSGRPERPQVVVAHGGEVRDPSSRDHVTRHEQRADPGRIDRHVVNDRDDSHALRSAPCCADFEHDPFAVNGLRR